MGAAGRGLYMRAIEEYEGPDGWVQAQRTRTYMTREGLLAFYKEYLGLLERYGYTEESAPPGARLMATRFLAIPQAQSQAEPPAP
jgi:hypothetical protein